MSARALALFGVLLVAAGCTTLDPVLGQAREDLAAGRGEQALERLERSARAHPQKREYRNEYHLLRDRLLAQWLAQAELLRGAGQPEQAEALYRRVQRHDAANPRARDGLSLLQADARHRALVGRAEGLAASGHVEQAVTAVREVLAENPRQPDARRLQRTLAERLAPPAAPPPRLALAEGAVSLELHDVSLRALFEALARNTGVSFVLDKDVRSELRTSLAVRQAAPEELIRLVLAAHQLELKVVNPGTALVFPNTPQKLREHLELVVKSFYLANADVRQTAAMMRSVLKTREIFVDEKLNLLVIKDTPAGVRLAERLIAAQDLAEPEVMLEVEVLEVASSRLRELGLRFPDSLAIGLTGAAGVPGALTLAEWLNRSSSLVQLSFSNPLFVLSLRQEDSATSVLANPRIRVRNREKARVHIGDRVPVITTTAAASGGFVSESVSYLDVGLKLEVEPLVHLDDEVGMRVSLEVSNIAREVRSPTSATLTYQIGTRSAATVLRLRDGETQVLAGLISDEERRAASRVPGLGEIPRLGRLFSHTRDTTNKTEIVLLITPRLVRTLVRPHARDTEFAAGIDPAPGAPSPLPAPAPPAPARPAEAR